MKRAALVGFVLVVAGLAGHVMDAARQGFWNEENTALGINLALDVVATAATTFFCLLVLMGKGVAMARTAVVVAVLIGAQRVFAAAVSYDQFMGQIVPSMGLGPGDFILRFHGLEIRSTFYALAMIILLGTVFRRRSLVIDRGNLVLVAVIATLQFMALYWMAGTWLALQRAAELGNRTETDFLVQFALIILGFLGTGLFWASLALAQRRHWQGEPAD